MPHCEIPGDTDGESAPGRVLPRLCEPERRPQRRIQHRPRHHRRAADTRIAQRRSARPIAAAAELPALSSATADGSRHSADDADKAGNSADASFLRSVVRFRRFITLTTCKPFDFDAFLMGENDNLYLTLQSIAADEFAHIVDSIPEPRVLTYPSHVNMFIRTAFPAKAMAAINTGFRRSMLLESVHESSDAGSVVCLCLNDTFDIELACEKLKLLTNCSKYLIVVPNIGAASRAIIDGSGLDAKLFEFRLDIIPFDSDCFTVPANNCFYNCFANNNVMDVYTISRALLKLELMTGNPNKVFVAGKISSEVNSLLCEFKDTVGSRFFGNEPYFDQLFIMDRSVDLVTPLLTQFYYGGMLDDRYDATYGLLRLPHGVVFRDQKRESTNVILTSPKDDVFANIKGLSCEEANEKIQELLEEVSSINEKLQNSAGCGQWKVYAKRAQKLSDDLPYINLHLNLLENVVKFNRFMKPILEFENKLLLGQTPDTSLIGRLINSGSYDEALRLACLYSVISNGVPAKFMNEICRRLIGKFGKEIIQDLIGLDTSGLLKLESSFFERIKALSFSSINNELNLVFNTPQYKYDNEGKTIGYGDIERGYDTYVPILLRLLQRGVTDGWEEGSSISNLMNQMGIEHKTYCNNSKATTTTEGKKRVLLFVVGGITMTESILIKQMGENLFDGNIEFHVGSTGIINGKRFINSLCPLIRK